MPDAQPKPEPRPAGCCGKCPPIVGGGYDCTCEDNPRCIAQPKPTAAEVLAVHPVDDYDGEGRYWCPCKGLGNGTTLIFVNRRAAERHQADMLAAAGYPTTPEVLAEHDAQVLQRAGLRACAACGRVDGLHDSVGHWSDHTSNSPAWHADRDAQVRRLALAEALDAVSGIEPYSQAHGEALTQAEDCIRAMILEGKPW